MKICSLCHKISGTNMDHLDCQEKRRIEIEEISAYPFPRMNTAIDKNELAIEIKTLLEYITRQKS